MSAWFFSHMPKEQSGGLYDAMLRMCWTLDDWDDEEEPLRVEQSGYVITMDEVGDIRIHHPLFVVEFLTDGGESWVEHRGLHDHYRQDVIALCDWFSEAFENYRDQIEAPL